MKDAAIEKLIADVRAGTASQRRIVAALKLLQQARADLADLRAAREARQVKLRQDPAQVARPARLELATEPYVQ